MENECKKCTSLSKKCLTFRATVELLHNQKLFIEKDYRSVQEKVKEVTTKNCELEQIIIEKDKNIDKLKYDITQINKGSEIESFDEIKLLRRKNKEYESDIQIQSQYIKTLSEDGKSNELLIENKRLMLEVKELKSSYESLKAEVLCKNCDLFKNSALKMKLTLKELQLSNKTKDIEISKLNKDISNLDNNIIKMNEDYTKLQQQYDIKNSALSTETQNFIAQIITLKAINFSQKEQLRKSITKHCKICKETAKVVFNCFNNNYEVSTRPPHLNFIERFKKIKFTILSHIQMSLIDEMIGDEELQGTSDKISQLLKAPESEILDNVNIERKKKRTRIKKNEKPAKSIDNDCLLSNNDDYIPEFNNSIKDNSKSSNASECNNTTIDSREQHINNETCDENIINSEIASINIENSNEYIENLKQAFVILKDMNISIKNKKFKKTLPQINELLIPEESTVNVFRENESIILHNIDITMGEESMESNRTDKIITVTDSTNVICDTLLEIESNNIYDNNEQLNSDFNKDLEKQGNNEEQISIEVLGDMTMVSDISSIDNNIDHNNLNENYEESETVFSKDNCISSTNSLTKDSDEHNYNEMTKTIFSKNTENQALLNTCNISPNSSLIKDNDEHNRNEVSETACIKDIENRALLNTCISSTNSLTKDSDEHNYNEMTETIFCKKTETHALLNTCNISPNSSLIKDNDEHNRNDVSETVFSEDIENQALHNTCISSTNSLIKDNEHICNEVSINSFGYTTIIEHMEVFLDTSKDSSNHHNSMSESEEAINDYSISIEDESILNFQFNEDFIIGLTKEQNESQNYKDSLNDHEKKICENLNIVPDTEETSSQEFFLSKVIPLSSDVEQRIDLQENRMIPECIIISDDEDDYVVKRESQIYSQPQFVNNHASYLNNMQSTPHFSKQLVFHSQSDFMNLSPVLKHQFINSHGTKLPISKFPNETEFDRIVLSDSENNYITEDSLPRNNSSYQFCSSQFQSIPQLLNQSAIHKTSQFNNLPHCQHSISTACSCPVIYLIYPGGQNITQIIPNFSTNDSVRATHNDLMSKFDKPLFEKALDLSKSKPVDIDTDAIALIPLSCIKKEKDVNTFINIKTNELSTVKDIYINKEQFNSDNHPSIPEITNNTGDNTYISESSNAERTFSGDRSVIIMDENHNHDQSLLKNKNTRITDNIETVTEDSQTKLLESSISQSFTIENEHIDVDTPHIVKKSSHQDIVKCTKRKLVDNECSKITSNKLQRTHNDSRTVNDKIILTTLDEKLTKKVDNKRGLHTTEASLEVNTALKKVVLNNITLKEAVPPGSSNTSEIDLNNKQILMENENSTKTKEQERNEEIQKRIENAKEISRKKSLNAPPLISNNNGKNQASNISQYISNKNIKSSKKPLSVLDKVKKSVQKSVQKQNNIVKFNDIRPINEKSLVILERSTKLTLDDLKVNNTTIDYISGNKRSKTDSDDIIKPKAKQLKLTEKTQHVERVKESSRFMNVKIAQLLNRKLDGHLLEKYQSFNSFIDSNVLLEEIVEEENVLATEVLNIFSSNAQLSLNDSRLKISDEIKRLKDCQIINLVTEIFSFVKQNSQSELHYNNLVPTASLMIVNLLILNKDQFSNYYNTLISMMGEVNSRVLIALISINITVLVWMKQADTIVSFIIDLISRSNVSMLLIARCIVINVSNMLSSKYGSFINLLKLIVQYEYSATSNENNKKFLSSSPENIQQFWLNGNNCSNFKPFTDLAFVISSVKKTMNEYEKITTKTNWSFLDRIIANKYQ